jgi:hypothetical protein
MLINLQLNRIGLDPVPRCGFHVTCLPIQRFGCCALVAGELQKAHGLFTKWHATMLEIA